MCGCQAREELASAESMGWQPLKSSARRSSRSAGALGEALWREQDVAERLHEELREAGAARGRWAAAAEVEAAAISTAEAAEARILQIEQLDRRSRVAVHMAETKAEKEVR